MKTEAITNMFLGLALADALGVPVEFKSRGYLYKYPVNSMLEFGTHNQPAGTWSDDSSLTFCLAESLIKGFNLSDIAASFIKWRHAQLWTPRGSVFDIGMQTRKSIDILQGLIEDEDFEGLQMLKYNTDEYSNGNGSLMRILPLLFFIKGKSIKQQFDIVWEVSALTHGHIRSAISCLIYLKFAEYLIEDNTIRHAYVLMQNDIKLFFTEEAISDYETIHFKRLIEHDISLLVPTKIKSDGYVINTLEASFWCLLTTDSYQESVFRAINLGGDTDTTAAVVGGIAGLVYGLESVPKQWIDSLARKDDIVDLSNQFFKRYSHES
ncbi:ADP-ribosylglycohydrolase family protein [Olleya sp. HaHaR_3_96]|uniref:ADP-ribosylglycohydrolase family protein n=1 Tax=Olleya sp. HaHaR_3_96 TaxID=2745560 RepID=UPI001C4E4139|nr:ADP-ribosylglycohydrolase family protein [Olleya sp. HaHaR_3_96]QXP61076.1 ADP-ribosylglycohydrolase family protein [Olleya sp. HaHaR_3_96]